MRNQNSRDAIHAKLAHEIKAAKKKLFKRSREGMSLREAGNIFCVDLARRFHAVVPDDETSPTSTEFVDDAPPPPTEDILTDDQLDYAISQMVYLAQSGPISGLVALIKHFRDLAVTGRPEEAKEDAKKCLGALASVGFERASRNQFLEDFKLDTGEDDTVEAVN